MRTSLTGTRSGSAVSILTENHILLMTRRLSRVRKPEFRVDFPVGQ